ncbi:DUF559 domain-containing protein [Nocardioides mesophilus]|uniref:DUF559 domain-containing protein n=1 Tax=Nocardioides mesophilus TaxID=433659 RepID=A0A7G9RA42_9ACTN|nr:DUF559 domain-containing protein [Nocardioides mesophilus]QNN52467.1 DUF559 domain-containing protein [Nocardioides mesophilus]
MTVTQVLHRLGGVASRKVLVRTTSRNQLRRAVARGEVVRDAHGRYALPVADEALRAANRLSGVVSHRSAALHWGWEVKTVPKRPDVTIRRKRHLAAHQGDGIEVHWYDVPSDAVVGVVTSPEQTLVDCMRGLPFDEALAVADSALRHRHITKARLIELADSVRGPGARQARRVARAATHLAANPFESVLRAIGLDVPGLHLETQVVISDKEGRGRADLVDRERRWVVEAESHSWHSKRGALRRDCRRYTKLTLLGWRVLRFAWEDVMFHPDYVRDCLLAAAEVADRQARCACGA